MASRTNTSRPHSAPGLYFSDSVLNYADKSLGITTLGVAGETLKGPAFQPIPVSDWREFQNVFGGTSAKKFKGSQYPKYELPYIAKTYLGQSNQLEVVRVLGLSGVNAGPAWVITATKHVLFTGWTYVQENQKPGTSYTEVQSVPSNDALKQYTSPSSGPTEYIKVNEGLEWKRTSSECDSGCDDSGTPITSYDELPNLNSDPVAVGTTYYIKTEVTTGVYSYQCFEVATGVKYYHAMWKSNVPSSEEDWCEGNHNNMVVAVLRSRGEHKQYSFVRTPTEDDMAQGICDDIYDYDGIEYYAETVHLEPSKSLTLGSSCNPGFSTTTGDFSVDGYNYGTFTIVVNKGDAVNEKRYSVSLNPADKNYIYNVIGGTPEDGDAFVYVEELYDVALRQLVDEGMLNAINKDLKEYKPVNLVPKYSDVDYILADELPTKRDMLKRFLCVNAEGLNITVKYSADGGTNWYEANPVDGMIYTVYGALNPETGKTEYFYGAYITETDGMTSWEELEGDPGGVIWTDPDDTCAVNRNTFSAQPNAELSSPYYIRVGSNSEYTYYKKVVKLTESNFVYDKGKSTEMLSPVNETSRCNNPVNECVRVAENDTYYFALTSSNSSTKGDNNEEEGGGTKDGGEDETTVSILPVTLDFNNYKEQYRYASTPWIVSEIKGSAEDIELVKLFRFHTISDGNESSYEVKVSIENIEPSTGKFDVVIRDFNDSDINPVVLERYNGCNMVPGTKDYIAYKIGSFDETYNSVSRFVTVEVNENDVTKNSVPAGFLGYPVRNYKGTAMCATNTESGTDILSTEPVQPYLRFNTIIDDEIRPRKQYFGMSDLTGIDTDVLSYKGVEAYKENPNGLTPCFHLDSRILNGTPDANGIISYGTITQTVSVEGEKGYSWVTVNKAQTTSEGIEPRIGSESTMVGTIYEDKRYRKFTVCFYGGWDGWDYYRTHRSNTDEFKYANYKGAINSTSGYGDMFSLIKQPEMFDLDGIGKAITSDYYAYLAGVRAFANPKDVEINVLATPGIDYVNNNLLVGDVIDMVEEERADCVYIVTTPDKPFGASDSKMDMYTPDEAVANLESSDIDSNHVASFYPWVKYFDSDNSEYIYLPITRDVVADIALTDNQAWPWFASAGWNRGIITGVGPRKKLKLAEQDTLYDGRLNFVANFGSDGCRVWGDKNMQISDNQLNRLSKRRLLLRIRTLLKNACIGLLFDPNDPNCTKALRSATSNVLDNIRANRGITDYRIEIDDSPSVTDQMGRVVTYFIKASPLLEWVSFQSVLTPQGVEW